MITKKQILPLLLEACPGFERAWRAHLDWWRGEQSGEFNDAAEFAKYLVESFENGQTSEFPAAFAVIEKILNEGDKQARDIAAIGIIEDLQTIGSNHVCGAEVFKPWLGETSTAAWHQIEKIWEGKSSLMDVLRAEKSS